MKGYKCFFNTLYIEDKHLDGSPAAEPRPEGGRYEKVDCWQEASHSWTGLTSQNEDRWETWGSRRLGERNCSDGAYVRVVSQTVHIWGGRGSRVWEAKGDFCSGVRLLWGKTTELWVNHFLSNWCGRREKRLDLFHCRKLHLFEFTCSEWEVKLHVCELPLAVWTYTWLRDTYDASYSFVVFLCVLQSSQLIHVLCTHQWEQVTFTYRSI